MKIKNNLLIFISVIASQIIFLSNPANAIDISSNTTISTDTSYSDVVVKNGATLTLDAKLTVSGNVTVESGGVITHTVGTSTNFDLEVGGTLNVQSGGKISANGKGRGGSGAGSSSSKGGTYGGVGKSSTKSVYGDIYNPTHVGSYGRQSSYEGGGLIKITAGNLINNGSITSNGDGHNTYGVGSGGGINITVTSHLSGAGTYEANGGKCVNNGYSGGGGRVAIRYGSIDNLETLKTNTSATGPGSAGEGTIYIKNTTSGSDNLIIKGDGGSHGTSISSGVTTLSNLIIDNARLYLSTETSSDSLIIKNAGVIILDNTFTVSGDATIEAGGIMSHSTGTSSAFDLNVSGTLNLETGAKISANGKGRGGSGAGSSSSKGGTYGGVGKSSSKSVYGDIYNPTHVGSYGRQSSYEGGGLIKITAGNLINNGSITSNGDGHNTYGVGSGGGINITVTSHLSGAGTYQANGGTCTNNNYNGGGGRIAIRYGTIDNLEALKANTSATGPGSAGEGTIYLKDTTADFDILIVKGDGGSHGTSISLGVTSLGNLIVTNARLYLSTETYSETLDISDGGVVILDNSFEISGDATIRSGGILSHSITNSSAFNLKVGGTLDLEAGSKITANGKGKSATGSNGSSSRGGTYGGIGKSSSKTVYGDIYNPVHVGSYGRQTSYEGGGLITITAGNLINNGSITANGDGHNTYSVGSGGGINITVTSHLSGNGIYQANGGTCTNNGYNGGGGRIAIKYGTVENLDTLKANTSAIGPGSAGAGTIYLKDNTVNYDYLIIKGDSGSATYLLDGMNNFGDIIIENAGLVQNIETNITNLYVKNGGKIYVNETLNVANNVEVESGGLISHSTVSVSLFNILVGGKVDVKSGGEINVDGRGIASSGTAGSSSRGGTYGGIGKSSSSSIYGDVYSPIHVGSYGRNTGYKAGGLIRIITQDLVNNGKISANGNNTATYSVGSGGGINITVNGDLSGNGIYQANGGTCTNNRYNGGGGRIAIKYGNVDDLENLKDSIIASGPGDAGEGTIYLKNITTGSDLLLVKGDTGSNGFYLPSSALTFENLILEDNAFFVLNEHLVINNNATVESGGVITHSTKNQTNFHIEVGGTFDIQNGGSINMNGRGIAATGTNGSNSRGGGYGGIGRSSSKNPYGDVYNPSHVGSYGRTTSYKGGGLIKITAGNLINDGSITANGNNTSTYGVGSGGGININVDQNISGAGTYQANGGTCTNNGYNGGGGRIAIKYGTTTDLDNLKSKISATGPGAAGEGTIYLKDNTSGDDILIIKGDGGSSGTKLLSGMTTFKDTYLENARLYLNVGANTENIVIESGGELYLDQTLAVSNDATIKSGGLITHSNGSSSSFNLQVGNILDIQNGGLISANGRGYASTGTNGSNSRGGGYGGMGRSSSKNPYGDVYNPSHVGSYGRTTSYRAGGLIRITAGNLINDGGITANGNNTSSYGVGSGGGINITVNENISGAGTYQANGGTCTNNGYNGGGGRIAIKYGSVDDLDILKSKISAIGPGAAGEGTIYLKDRTAGTDQLLIKGDGVSSNNKSGVGTSYSNYYFDNIEANNYGKAYLIGTQSIIASSCTTSTSGYIDPLINCSGEASFKLHDILTNLQGFEVKDRKYEYIVEGPDSGLEFISTGTGIISGNGFLTKKIKLTKLGNYKIIFNLYDGSSSGSTVEATATKNLNVATE